MRNRKDVCYLFLVECIVFDWNFLARIYVNQSKRILPFVVVWVFNLDMSEKGMFTDLNNLTACKKGECKPHCLFIRFFYKK